MKEKILELLKQVEKDYNVKILFAVESGSRSWGFPSEDSDYDVRAVHIGSPERYLGLNHPPNEIEFFPDTKPKIDIVSWDIKKFAKLFLASNPTVSEWLESKIAYIESPYRKKLEKIFKNGFSRYTLKKHYVALSRGNYEKYIKNEDVVSLKKYIYILRGLACVEYLLKESTMPPLNYKNVIGYLPKDMAKFMEEIVAKKQRSEELKGRSNKDINKQIERYFAMEFEKTGSNFNKEQINDLVIEIIKSYK